MARRGQNEGSIFKRADGRWCAQVNLGYVNGKRKRKYFYGDTRKEVQEQLTKALRDVQQGLPVPTDRLTVEKFLTRWLEDNVKPTVRPRTYVRYKQAVDTHFAPALGKTVLTKLTAHQVQGFVTAKLGEKLSPRTVAHLLSILRIALGQAVRWNLVHRNVAELATPPHVERFVVQPLTPEQARTFLESIQGDRHEALYTTVMAVGLRQSEAFGLKWEDIDLDAGTLSVRRQLQRIDKRPQFTEPKSATAIRTLALPAFAVAALRRHKVKQSEDRLFTGSRWQEWGLVFTSTIGTPLTKNIIKPFRAALTRAGLPSQRFHDLRHGCASLLLAQGVQPRVIMEILGHSQIGITMNLYSHVAPDLQRSVAAQMDTLFTAPK